MAPPMISTSTFSRRWPSRSSLVEILAPPTIATSGRAGLSSTFSKASSSACSVRPAKAGSRWLKPSVEAWARCDTEKASLTNRSPSLASAATKAGSFFSSPGVKARVLQAEDVAGVHRRHRALGHVADAVVDEFDRPLDGVGDFGGDGLERVLGVAALRPAEMRQQDHLGALVGEFGDRRRGALDAGGVGHHAVLDRHVEVDAHQARVCPSRRRGRGC